MKQLKDAFVYRGFATDPRSTQALMRQFTSSPTGSVSELLRSAGPFVAARDGYRFTNTGWAITEEDARTLRQHYQPVVDAAAKIGIEAVRASLAAFAVGPATLSAVAIDLVIDRISRDLRNQLADSIIGAIPGSYGRCGGMAFSALDFYLSGWPVTSFDVKPNSGDLRQYIWDRLLDSVDLNGLKFLEWILDLHILPVISKLATRAIGAVAGAVMGPPGIIIGEFIAGESDVLGLGGADMLLDKTRDELRRLGRRLVGAAAWPIGIIYGNNPNPVDQHQVLAIGLKDSGDGTEALDIWDNNDGASCRKLHLDLRGNELEVTSSNPDLNDVKGIICEEYSVKSPPLALRLPATGGKWNWNPLGCM